MLDVDASTLRRLPGTSTITQVGGVAARPATRAAGSKKTSGTPDDRDENGRHPAAGTDPLPVGCRPWSRPAGVRVCHVRAAGEPAGDHFLPGALPSAESEESAAMKASCGTSTRPTIFIRFLPSFCFSSSLRFRLMSPP
jgi:hypothetical protein